MRKHRLTPSVAVVLLAGCAIPERDNPFDPAVAPLARVVDRSLGGSCDLPEPGALPDALPEVVSASRQACLAIDARERDASSYRFHRIDEDGDAIEELPDLDDGVGFAPITPEQLRQWPVGELRFRVEARRNGVTGVAVAEVTIVNRPPIAVGGPPLYVPAGGHDWAPGDPVTLRFDGSRSYDPDDDPVVGWAWTFPSGLVATTTSGDVVYATVTAIDEPSRRLVELRVFDGDAWSDPALVQVRIGAAPQWYGRDIPGYVTTELSAVDPLQTYPAYPDVSSVAWNGGDRAVIAVNDGFGGGTDIHLVQWPSGVLLASAPYAHSGYTPVTRLFVDEARQRVWGVDADNAVISRFDLTGGGQTGIQPVSLSNSALDSGILSAAPPFAVFDSAGNVWVSGSFASLVQLLDDSGTELARFDVSAAYGAGWGVAGLALRPGTQDVWALVGSRPLDELPDEPSHFVRLRYSAGAIVATPFLPAAEGPDRSYFAEWADGRRFWTYLAGAGLALVDAARLEAGATLDAAIVHIAEVVNPGRITVDRLTGDAWYVSEVGGSAVTRVSTDGTTHEFEATSAEAYFVDDEGLLCAKIEGVLRRGIGGSASGVLVEAPVAVFDADSDTTGGIWTTVLLPSGLQRFGSDGTVFSVNLSLLPAPGESDPVLQFVLGLDVEGSGERGWILEGLPQQGGSLRLVEVGLGAPAGQGALSMLSASQPSPSQGTRILEASGAGDPFVWVDADDGIHRITSTTDELVLPLPELDFEYPMGARGGAGDLCVGYVGDALTTGTALTLVRVSPAGSTVFSHPAISATPGEELFLVDVGATRDLCWVSLHTASGPRIEAWGAGGAPVIAIDDGVLRCGFWPESATRIWTVRNAEQNPSSFPIDCLGTPERLDFEGGVWTSVLYDDIEDAERALAP